MGIKRTICKASKLSDNCNSCLRIEPATQPIAGNSDNELFPAPPPVSELEWVDSELDLWDIMSTWPDIFGTCQNEVSSVVNNDLSGQSGKKEERKSRLKDIEKGRRH